MIIIAIILYCTVLVYKETLGWRSSGGGGSTVPSSTLLTNTTNDAQVFSLCYGGNYFEKLRYNSTSLK